jgi:hypothetical protein
VNAAYFSTIAAQTIRGQNVAFLLLLLNQSQREKQLLRKNGLDLMTLVEYEK